MLSEQGSELAQRNVPPAEAGRGGAHSRDAGWETEAGADGGRGSLGGPHTKRAQQPCGDTHPEPLHPGRRAVRFGAEGSDARVRKGASRGTFPPRGRDSGLLLGRDCEWSVATTGRSTRLQCQACRIATTAPAFPFTLQFRRAPPSATSGSVPHLCRLAANRKQPRLIQPLCRQYRDGCANHPTTLEQE